MATTDEKVLNGAGLAELWSLIKAEDAEVAAIANSKAPAYTYGADDLTAGSSSLTTGKLHFVYE